MSSLILGPVAFADFELPASIAWGGRQRLAIHQLPGGARVIDAMGRDDAPLGWSGVFSGPDAVPRARTLDLLRAAGLPSTAQWDDFSYTVVVSDFAARYERNNWVPYRIVCTVLADDATAAATPAPTLLAGLLADLGLAATLGGLDLGVATSAVALSGALSAGGAANAAAAASLAIAAGTVAQQLASSGAVLVASGDFPTLAAAAQQSAQSAAARGYLLRAHSNLALAGG